jgi:hypothetical protein
MRKILFFFFAPSRDEIQDLTKNLQFSESYGIPSDLDALIIMPGHEKAKSGLQSQKPL